MMHESDYSWTAPARRVERNLVEVFDQHVIPLREQALAEIPSRPELKRVARADAVNINAVEVRARGASLPAARQNIHSVPARCDTSEDFVEMHFGSAAVGILSIVPVDDEDPHSEYAGAT